MAYLGKKYNGPVTSMEIVKKEDLVRPHDDLDLINSQQNLWS